MKNTIIYFMPNYGGSDVKKTISQIKSAGFKCLFAESASVLVNKIVKARAVLFDKRLEILLLGTLKTLKLLNYNFVKYNPNKPLITPYAHQETSKGANIFENCILLEQDNWNNFILDLANRKDTLLSIKESLDTFFEYIDMPMVNTSAILIKHILFYMVENNLRKCSFNIINYVCNYLNLKTSEEITIMRRNVKKWCRTNIKPLSRLYPEVDISKVSSLIIINLLKECYDLNYHKLVRSKMGLIKKKIEEYSKNDFLFLNKHTDVN